MGYGITSKTTKNDRKKAAKTATRNSKVKTTKRVPVKTEVKAAIKKTVKKTTTPRAVTFEIVMVNNRRTFRPVNKRAKALAEFSSAKVLTAKHLKALKALKFRVLETVTLNPISL